MDEREDRKKTEESSEGKRRCDEKDSPAGYVIPKKGLWLAAGGAVGALAILGIGRMSKKLRPAAVGVVREGYAFKEWAAARAERMKEDMEDIVAEAKHAYHKDIEATQETIRKERDLLHKMEEAVEKKMVRKRTKKEE